MGDIKQTNFRIDTETADRFRSFCEESGMNQAQGFDHIMAVLEMDKAKAAVPERVTEIEEFERHTKSILSAYLGSLEIAKNTEERVLEQFKTKLESKDGTILKLQNEIRGKEDLLTAANTVAMESENAKNRAESEMKIANDRRRDAEKIAQDKAAIADMLQVKLTEAEAKLVEYPELKASESDLKVKLAESLQTIKDNQREAEIAQERAVAAVKTSAEKEMNEILKKAEKDVQELQNELKTSKREAEIEQERAVAAAQKEADQLVSAAKAETAEVKAELAGVKAASAEKEKQLAKLESKNDELQALIAELKAKNAALEMQNNALETQIRTQIQKQK